MSSIQLGAYTIRLRKKMDSAFLPLNSFNEKIIL